MKGALLMSTITKTWTEDKIRSIIRKLDEKTGLNGAALPIKLASHGSGPARWLVLIPLAAIVQQPSAIKTGP